MTLDELGFFPEGTEVLALPNWCRPKLFVRASPWFLRWKGTALFPAFRLGARVRRTWLRVWAQLGGEVRKAVAPYVLGEVIREVWGHRGRPLAVLLGTPGPAQKATVLVADSDGQPLGYIKCATASQAKKRLERESQVLQVLPRDQAPQALGLFDLPDLRCLALSPVWGKPFPLALLPPQPLLTYLRSLPRIREGVLAQEHPWIQRLLKAEPQSATQVELLEGRTWLVVAEHGDLAPWNVLLTPLGPVAIDWEYGSLEGFPGADLAYYVLQVSYLIHKLDPDSAHARAMRVLVNRWGMGTAEASALVRLTALRAFLENRLDGMNDADPLQVWRRQIWQGS